MSINEPLIMKKTIIVDNFEFNIDTERTKKLYEESNEFECNCKDCINYTLHFSEVQQLLNGFDTKLGFDVTKDVGICSDELMPHDFEIHHLYVIPYYIYGEFSLKKPWYSRKKNKIEFSNNLSVSFQDISNKKWFDINSKAFVINLEFKTPLVTIEEIEKLSTKNLFTLN